MIKFNQTAVIKFNQGCQPQFTLPKLVRCLHIFFTKPWHAHRAGVEVKKKYIGTYFEHGAIPCDNMILVRSVLAAKSGPKM